MNKKVICLMGLTGSGKTDLAMKLYDAAPCEIISVDSAMIYKCMDIGTAKPEPELLEKYPHFLIDIVEPTQSYSAADFVSNACPLINAIHERGNIPILVGGTMMYFKALQQGLNQLPESQTDIRQQLQLQKAQHGLAHLYEQLQQCDPVMAQKLKPNDSQRILRALEVFQISKQPMSELLKAETRPVNFNFENFAIIPTERKSLHQRLADRFELMLANGFEAEVSKLISLGVDVAMPSMRCVGYKQMAVYLQGQVTYQEMKQRAIAATRQLAKRQHTWLRKWPDLTILAMDEVQQEHMVNNILRKIR